MVYTVPQVDGWADAEENYTFIKSGNQTNLKIDVDVNNKFVQFFQKTWPKALNALKEICEN